MESKSTTNYVDKDGTIASRYMLKGILDGTETETTKEVSVWAEQYKRIPLKRPGGGVTLPYDVVQTDKDKTRETYAIILSMDTQAMFIWIVISWTELSCGGLILVRIYVPEPITLNSWCMTLMVTVKPK